MHVAILPCMQILGIKYCSYLCAFNVTCAHFSSYSYMYSSSGLLLRGPNICDTVKLSPRRNVCYLIFAKGLSGFLYPTIQEFLQIQNDVCKFCKYFDLASRNNKLLYGS